MSREAVCRRQRPGSSEAVAPGEAELLSFLKCQRGTGTGSTLTFPALHLHSSKWIVGVLFVFFSFGFASSSDGCHPWGVNKHLIPDNKFKSHGRTLRLKEKKRNSTQKEPKEGEGGGSLFFWTLSFFCPPPTPCSLVVPGAKTQNKSHLLISSRRSQEAQFKKKTSWSPRETSWFIRMIVKGEALYL